MKDRADEDFRTWGYVIDRIGWQQGVGKGIAGCLWEGLGELEDQADAESRDGDGVQGECSAMHLQMHSK